jgi:hypothetical protein
MKTSINLAPEASSTDRNIETDAGDERREGLDSGINPTDPEVRAKRRELLIRGKALIESGERSLRDAAVVLGTAQEKCGASQREIAAEVGRSPAWVNKLLKWRKAGYPSDTPFGPASKAARRRKKAVQAPERQKGKARAQDADKANPSRSAGGHRDENEHGDSGHGEADHDHDDEHRHDRDRRGDDEHDQRHQRGSRGSHQRKHDGHREDQHGENQEDQTDTAVEKAEQTADSDTALTELKRAIDECLPRMDSASRQRATDYFLVKVNECAANALRSKEL